MTAWLTLALVVGADPTSRIFDVDGEKREAIVYAPAKKSDEAAPLVFGWHGHGGTAKHAAGVFRIHQLWPEAVVIYAQGLPTPGKFDPEGTRAGWQKSVGDQKDRDLKFFDVMLEAARKDFKIDHTRINSTGHSNGGGFTYLLWAARGETFAAFAPSAAGPGRALTKAAAKPVLHVSGEKDTTVPFENQKRAVGLVRNHNGCAAEGKEWGKGGTLYPGKDGADVIFLTHPGDHKYPSTAPEQIVAFFKQYPKK
jgi:polyhydroxybutyrate depolymerase